MRKQCPDGGGFWRWRDDTGQLVFGTKCLASTGSRGAKDEMPKKICDRVLSGRVRMEDCDESREQQLVEVGQWGR